MMACPTVTYYPASDPSQALGVIADPEGTWRFEYDPDQTPATSSDRKRVYRGTFASAGGADPIAACAVTFSPGRLVTFGNECANLGLLSSLGVGPRLLAVAKYRFENTSQTRPVIIEEDAGVVLARLLSDSGGGAEGTDAILHPIGTPERDLENLKIRYDIFVQVANAHNAGVYHRDLRCENVCVRRFGEGATDIRATVIDFELSATQASGRPRAHAPIYRTLFSLVPTHIAGRELVMTPNPLELDMGYLAALQYHITRGGLDLNGDAHTAESLEDFVRFLKDSVDYFDYEPLAAHPHARRLTRALDLDGIAETLELVPVDERHFPSNALLERAAGFHRPYLDGKDLKVCMSGPEARLASVVDRLVVAKFETYKALRREQGLEVIYERVEDQPEDLRRSGYAQAEHIPEKVRALGLLLVSEEEGSGFEEVTSFTDDQVETLARIEHDRWVRERLDAGWTLDRTATKGDPVRKTSPYLVPYDELSFEIQEYDRDPARQLIPLVKSAGLMVVRPRS